MPTIWVAGLACSTTLKLPQYLASVEMQLVCVLRSPSLKVSKLLRRENLNDLLRLSLSSFSDGQVTEESVTKTVLGLPCSQVWAACTTLSPTYVGASTCHTAAPATVVSHVDLEQQSPHRTSLISTLSENISEIQHKFLLRLYQHLP